MPHIHTQQGHHDLTVSAYVFRTDFDQPKLLLHWHKKLNKWLQFGGHVELHENPWQAIAHELLEESGYDLDQLKIVQPADRLTSATNIIVHPQPVLINTHAFDATHNHIGIDYAFVTDEEPRHPVAADESQEVCLLTRDELMALPADKIYDATREISLYIFDVIVPQWKPVATGTYTSA